MIGQTVSHYRILEKLGGGGMGVVYKAEDTKLGRTVALKVLPPERVTDPNRKRRFVQEARAASALNHPNIITIYDIDEAEGVHYIAMEHVEGKTLDRLIARHGLRVNEALKYAVQMAAALAKAHSAGIVHRDLKPTNVMVTDDGLVKVLDFGLAKLTEAATSEESTQTQEPTTEEGTIVGTVGYMSPEQAEGKAVDARSDIFSFGSVLYEMLTGQRAFQGDSKASTIAAILREEPKPLSQAVEGLPREVERVVKRCLRKDPAHRFQHTDDLKVALEELKEESDSGELADTAAVGAGLARPREGRALPYMRWALVVGGALIVLVSLLLGLNVGGLRDRLAFVVGARSRSSGMPLPKVESLAVLPLENLSRDPEQEYFADGMTDALIAELGQIGSLRVISRTSAMRYKKTDKPMSQIAKELNVDALIEGSVLRAGDRIRITAQLIGAVPERHLWARSYERDLRDVLSLQGEIARIIADEVKVNVTPDVQVRLASRRPVNPDAHEAYLKGRYHWNLRTEDGLKKSVEYFQRAIEKDPAYALAYAGLADSYVILGDGVMAPREAYPRGKAAAFKALEIDETLAEAHAPLGAVREVYDWDWVGAEKEYKRAIELNPGYATAHQWYAMYLSEMGRHNEAIAEIRRAQELDPLSLIINATGGHIFFFARRYDEAIAQCRRTLELNPGFYSGNSILGWAYEQEKLYTQAISEYQKAIALEPGSPEPAGDLGRAYAAAGKRTEALKVISQLRELSKRRYVSPYLTAQIYAALGDFDQACAWLEKAYEERSGKLCMLKVDPRNDPLRSDPRFQDLLRRMNFPP